MRPACGAPECDREARARGLCFGHYQRLKKGQPLDPPLQQRSKREVPTYSALHQRLRRVRGRAQDHPCAEHGCGEQATQWAYLHLDLDPVREKGRTYSLDLSLYAPMCRRHHDALDVDIRSILRAS